MTSTNHQHTTHSQVTTHNTRSMFARTGRFGGGLCRNASRAFSTRNLDKLFGSRAYSAFAFFSLFTTTVITCQRVYIDYLELAAIQIRSFKFELTCSSFSCASFSSSLIGTTIFSTFRSCVYGWMSMLSSDRSSTCAISRFDSSFCTDCNKRNSLIKYGGIKHV